MATHRLPQFAAAIYGNALGKPAIVRRGINHETALSPFMTESIYGESSDARARCIEIENGFWPSGCGIRKADIVWRTHNTI